MLLVLQSLISVDSVQSYSHGCLVSRHFQTCTCSFLLIWTPWLPGKICLLLGKICLVPAWESLLIDFSTEDPSDNSETCTSQGLFFRTLYLVFNCSRSCMTLFSHEFFSVVVEYLSLVSLISTVWLHLQRISTEFLINFLSVCFFFLFLILFAWSVHFFLFKLFFLFLPYSSRLFVDANSGIVRFQDCQNLACQIFIPQYVLAWLILPRSYSSIRTTFNSDFICFGPAWLHFNALLLGFAIPRGHNFTHISGMCFQGTVLLWNSPNNSWSILLW